MGEGWGGRCKKGNARREGERVNERSEREGDREGDQREQQREEREREREGKMNHPRTFIFSSKFFTSCPE
jgi:hypothetical protein